MKPAFSKELIHGSCLDLSSEGKGICKDKGRVIFVPGFFPGEEADLEISYRRNGQLFGRVIKLTKPSPDRIEPKCRVCTACGGCQFQQYAYQAQLDYKQKQVQEQFRKIAKLVVNPLPTLGMENPYFYRNKIQMPFGVDGNGHIYCGFYKENSHVIVPIEQCFIEDERGAAILKSVKKLMAQCGVAPYIEENKEGVIRHVLIRTSHAYPEVMVVLVTHDYSPKLIDFVHALLAERPEITTLVQSENKKETNVILGDTTKTLFGPGYIKDKLGGLDFKISARSFYQTNPIMTEILYKTAMDFAKLQPTDVVFDAYSGIGTIGLIAAKSVASVISVEIVPEAVQDAIENAKANGITNFEAVADDASTYINRLAEQKQHIDVLFMDPPRRGSDERFLKAIKHLKPSRVIYVSCDPSSLARDAAFLNDDYKVSALQPVDLFPQTVHVETVCELSLRNADKH
jgi:23S rRNA (uracil1939-C5)-methyltransferase